MQISTPSISRSGVSIALPIRTALERGEGEELYAGGCGGARREEGSKVVSHPRVG